MGYLLIYAATWASSSPLPTLSYDDRVAGKSLWTGNAEQNKWHTPAVVKLTVSLYK